MVRLGSDDLLHTALSLSLKVQELCDQASKRTAQGSSEKRSTSSTRVAQRPSSFLSSTIYRGVGGGKGVGGGGQDTRAGRKAPGSPMTSLIDKVKQLEGDLTARGGAPQLQLGLLRDLHCRAVDIEHLMTDSLSDQQTVWIAERESLSQALHDSKNQIQDLKHSHDGAVSALRTRYQNMLDQAQGALEIQTRAARAQIYRLEEALRRTQQEAQVERLRTSSSAQHVERDNRERSEGAAEGTPFRGEGNRRAAEQADTRLSSPMPSPSQAEALQSSIAAINRSHIEEVLALRRLVQQTNDELESARAASREAQSTHTAELQDLLREITAQNESHDDTVAVLEGSIKEMQDDIFQLRASPDRSPPLLRSDSREQDLVEALRAAEVQIHQIEHRYELKCDEMDALLRYVRYPPPACLPLPKHKSFLLIMSCQQKLRRRCSLPYYRSISAQAPVQGPQAPEGDTSAGFVLEQGVQDFIVNRFEDHSHHELNPLFPKRNSSRPPSPTAAQRMRNVRLNSENTSSRAAALGASLSAQTVRDMRMILNQISENDLRGVQCLVEENRAVDIDEARKKERESGVGTGREWNSEKREFTIDGDDDRDFDHAASASALAPRSSGPVSLHPATHRPEGQGVGKLEEEYARRLRAAGQEMASLSASLEAERRINDTLSAQLHRAADVGCDYFAEPAIDLDGEEQERGQGENQGEGQEQGQSDRKEQGQGPGQGQGSQANRYTTHKTYSSFMQEAALEIKEPTGEGTIFHHHTRSSLHVTITSRYVMLSMHMKF